MTPKQFNRWIAGRQDVLVKNLIAAETATAKQADGLAKKHSSGGIPANVIRRLKGPYSVRAGFLDPSIVNDQGGDLARSWKVVTPTRYGDEIRGGADNTSRVAPYLFGRNRPRSKMRLRSLPDRVQDEIRRDRQRRLDQAVKKTLG